MTAVAAWVRESMGISERTTQTKLTLSIELGALLECSHPLVGIQLHVDVEVIIMLRAVPLFSLKLILVVSHRSLHVMSVIKQRGSTLDGVRLLRI